jgi:hypothetical protein
VSETTKPIWAEAPHPLHPFLVDTPAMNQLAPYPQELEDAVYELRYLEGWLFTLTNEDRGQGCRGLTLSIYPNKPDSYHPENHVRTVFTFPVPAAAFNRESWEEWLWARIVDVENHERAEWFRFETTAAWELHDKCARCSHEATDHDGRDESCSKCGRTDGHVGTHRFEPAEPRQNYRRPFKPAHADGWDPSTVRTVVSETVTNTPNAGRLVRVPCLGCDHYHEGRMGEHFVIERLYPCRTPGCECLA